MVISLLQLVYIFYFVLTTLIFFISFNMGSEGVALRIFGGGDDGFLYWNVARSIAEGIELERLWITSIYPVIVGYILKITGIESAYVIRIFNYIGFMFLTLLSLKMLRLYYELDKPNNSLNLKGLNNARIIMLLCLLGYASLVAYSTLSIYRDIWIYTLYLLAAFISVKLIFMKRKRKVLLFILFIAVLLLLGEFRGYALLSFVSALVLYLFYIKIFKKMKRPVWFVLICLLLFGVYYTYFLNFTVPYLNMSLQDALNYRHSFLTVYAGGSQMWINLCQPSFILFLINYLHSYLGNLLGPLPWHINGMATLAVFILETIPMTLILIYLWKKRNFLTPVHKYVIFHALVWIAFIALSNDNLGAATRLRAVGWVLILTVFASMAGRRVNVSKELNS